MTTAAAAGASQPKRILIVSANMGEGHNATGRALAQAAGTLWPDVRVEWVDTLDVMGRGIGPLFRGIYVANVEKTPWLYEFFYRAVRRMHWLAGSSKRFIGAWCGRRLAGRIADFQPDLILSTYPLGSAGLAWLREHRELTVPIGAWVSDFSPHPFWVYRELDRNFVMHQVAVRPAHEWVRGAHVAVSAPTVTSKFVPGDRAEARRATGLPADAFIALVSCGSLGFGSVETAANTLLAADPNLVVVVACGRNEHVRQRLLAGGDHGGRLHALGWTEQMAELTMASDVVVTNAGGATSLEALACGRPLLMYRPIAAHGLANAELMAEAGLAQVCHNERELTEAIRELQARPERLAAMSAAAVRHSSTRTVADGLLDLAGSRADLLPPARRLRAEDALFVHVQTRQVPQQVGAVLILDAKADGTPATLADAAHLVSAAPGLFGRLDLGSAWRHPRWLPDARVRVEELVEPVELGKPDGPSDLDGAMDSFFSVPLDGTTGTGRAQLVQGLGNGQSALLIKLHHASADGIAVIGALVGQARGQQFISEAPAGQPDTKLERPASVAALATGLWTLARAGKAKPTALNGRVHSPDRHHARVDLPISEVRAVARALKARTTDLATALVAEALHRVLHDEGPGPDVLRVMMPRSTRTTATFRTAGNRTGAASVDLPTGALSLAERVAQTRAATDSQVEASAPHAAHAVVWMLGLLPPWLHAVAARLVYRGTWFNAIASVLPGTRSPVFLRGSKVSTVYPVLALAPGVRLSVGVMTWADQLTVCFTGDRAAAGRVDALAEAMRAAFKEARAATA